MLRSDIKSLWVHPEILKRIFCLKRKMPSSCLFKKKQLLNQRNSFDQEMCSEFYMFSVFNSDVFQFLCGCQRWFYIWPFCTNNPCKLLPNLWYLLWTRSFILEQLFTEHLVVQLSACPVGPYISKSYVFFPAGVHYQGHLVQWLDRGNLSTLQQVLRSAGKISKFPSEIGIIISWSYNIILLDFVLILYL